ncbi:hypothetical protein IFM89_024310 [Coptis chinensis]|uniref:AB hydrolase-1 domain-containing protein n=1 Tax=Coptis chinensis TaxID=261450 RepID=A0A835H5I6_9MAGN|nr:hypothetical protein IFM89_024310 [Coptis chinensis]
MLTPGKWPEKTVEKLITASSLVVFTFLDILDIFLCFFYRKIDAFLEGNTTPCYCNRRGQNGKGGEEQPSETLYERKNIFRELGFFGNGNTTKRETCIEKCSLKKVKRRWSDCSCESCVSWQQQTGEYKLHVVVKEPSKAVANQDAKGKEVENVIFLHGFGASSSFWVESVFPNLSESGNQNYRIFAVDLLGFGKSPKPWDCLYTLKDHMEMVEQSVIDKYSLNSFHLVAHSMGCIIASALASKYLKAVTSITLVSPPYFRSPKVEASLTALNTVADRRLWPPLLFGSSVMSWYEHVGRSICFIVCRNHQRWEWILKLFSRRRDLHFMIVDFTRHTHHSAWHTMHNVICGGAKLMDEYLEAIKRSRVVVKVIQGDKDQVTPLECSRNLKLKIPLAEVQIISNADHSSVIFGREQHFTRDLEHLWLSASKEESLQEVVLL